MDDRGDDTSLYVLHGLRLSGFCAASAVAERWGLDLEVVESELDRMRRAGWVSYRQGRMSGWSLSAEGRAEGERRLSSQLDRLGARASVEEAYRSFLTLNGGFLALCTDWQIRPAGASDAVPNDHSDAGYDAAVVDRLAGVHRPVVGIVEALAARLERFGSYAGRFRHALERVRANDVDWFTKPVIDSYHTVWFELHEDLLATLGLARTSERRAEERTG